MPHFGKTLERLIRQRRYSHKAFIAEANIGSDTLYRNLRSPIPSCSTLTYELIASALKMSSEQLEREWRNEKDEPAAASLAKAISIEADQNMQPIPELLTWFKTLAKEDRQAIYAMLGQYVQAVPQKKARA